ncbi:MAG: hypothetical protein ACYS7M_10120, partial [Planctomycetota bacterium]
AQNGTSFTAATTPVNSDNTILLDRWIYVAEAADAADVSQDTTQAPDGSLNSIKFLVTGTNNNQFGIIQILEAEDTARAVLGGNGKVSLSFEARTTTGNALTNIRAAILEWSGTADQPTRPVITAFNPSGSDPTLATSWTYANTPENLALVANAWTAFTITGQTLLAGTTNLAVLIWLDDDNTTANDELYIGNVQLVVGDRVDEYGHRSYAEELALCQRYLQVFSAGAVEEPFGGGINITATTSSFMIPLMNTMRTKPTAVTVGSAATDFRVASEATVDACSAITFATATPNMVKLDTVHSAIGTAGFSVMLEAVNANAKLTFIDANL